MSRQWLIQNRPRAYQETEGVTETRADGLDESAYHYLFVDQVLAQTELDGNSLLDARGVGVKVSP